MTSESKVESCTTVDCGLYQIFRDGKSPYWHLRATIGKRRRSKTTDETDLAAAKRRAKTIYADLVRGMNKPDERFFNSVWNEFVDVRSIALRVGSQQRLSDIGRLYLIPEFGSLFLDEIEAKWPVFVRKEMARRPGTPLFNERKYMIACLRYAVEVGYLARIPKLIVPKPRKSPGRVLSDDEITRLLGACANDSGARLRILMGVTMGMRHGEIVYLEMCRVDLERRVVILNEEDTKTGNARMIQFSKPVEALIVDRVKSLKGLSPFLFPQLRNPMQPLSVNHSERIFAAIKRTAKVTCRFHDLRHTCATRLAASQVPAEVSCAYLGMSLKIFDKVYCHLTHRDTAVASDVVKIAVDLIGGKSND